MSLEKFDTYQLAVRFHRACETLALPAYLRDQFLRASSSVVLNIAEGAGRISPADQRRHYAIALGSLRESQAALELARVRDATATELSHRIAGCLYRLCHPRRP